jgi:hypothetical protein
MRTIIARQGQSVTAAADGLGMLWLFGDALAAPFLAGFRNILGLFIIGLGLYEAWRLNRRPQLVLSGPHRLKAAG